MADRLARPQFNKTPFGGTPAPDEPKAAKRVSTNALLPSRKALEQVTKPGSNIMEFNRLDPLGSGSLSTDFLNSKKPSF